MVNENHSSTGPPHPMEEKHRVMHQTLCEEGIAPCGDGRVCEGERYQ